MWGAQLVLAYWWAGSVDCARDDRSFGATGADTAPGRVVASAEFDFDGFVLRHKPFFSTRQPVRGLTGKHLYGLEIIGPNKVALQRIARGLENRSDLLL
jgi:hypothetical protein